MKIIFLKLYFLFFIFLIFLSKFSSAQNKTDKLFITIQPEYGTIVAHHEELLPLSLYNFPNLELNIYKQNTGKELWEKNYNYPQSGISFYYSALSNKHVFGEAFAIMPFGSFTFFRHKKHEQQLKISAGIAYLTRPYDSLLNIENIAIGSHFNASIKFQYSFLYRFNENIALSFGTSFAHFSNGAVKYPNWGLNIFSFSTGLHLKINKNPIRFEEPKIEPYIKKWHPYIWGAYGVKQNSETDHKLYNALTVGFGISRAYKYGKEWMIGSDIFYDYTDKVEFSHYNLHPSDIELIKIGIYAGHEWNINRFSIAFQTGLYFIAYKKDNLSKRIYDRIAIRYRLFNSLHANISIKAHYAKADYIEWGLLYKFR